MHADIGHRGAVSVVIPVFDGDRFLGAALESALAQSVRPLEVIVVDDGSRDASVAVAESFAGVRVIKQANAGPAAARNVGVDAAAGDLIAFLDADDLMAPGRLEFQVEYLATNPQAGAVMGRQEVIMEPGAVTPWWALEPSPWVKHIPAGEHMSVMTLMVRREVFATVGPFDPSLRIGEDIDWLFRARELGVEVAMVEDVLVHRRVHDRNLTLDYPANRAAMFRVLKARIDRKRAAAGQVTR